MWKRFKLGLAVVCCLGQIPSISFADAQSPEQTAHYEWGRGFSVPAADLNFGGYFHGSFKDLHGQAKNSASLDDLSLFVSWSPHALVRFFSEIELENWLSTQTGIHLQSAVRVERLYVDLFASESLNLRLGKFLTPFGDWNVTHAAPLVWTSTRPLATDKQLFPSHVNGLMVKKRFILNEHDLSLSLYIDDSVNLDVHKDTFEFHHAVGGRLHYEIYEQLKLGVSYLAFNKQGRAHQARNHLVGTDLLWKNNEYELKMEWNYRYAHDSQGSESNFYLQGVAPVPSAEHLFAIGRYEYLQGRHAVESDMIPSHTHLGVAGLAWRPFTPLIIKAEYRLGTGNQQVAPSGFFTSISMLF
jgi:hypothetical protein